MIGSSYLIAKRELMLRPMCRLEKKMSMKFLDASQPIRFHCDTGEKKGTWKATFSASLPECFNSSASAQNLASILAECASFVHPYLSIVISLSSMRKKC